MKSIMAVVADSRRLELSEPLSLPTGTRVCVEITGPEEDYGARVSAFYENMPGDVFEEERAVANSLGVADAVVCRGFLVVNLDSPAQGDVRPARYAR